MKWGTSLVQIFTSVLVLILAACSSDEDNTKPSPTPQIEYTVSVMISQLDNTLGSLVLRLSQEQPETVTENGLFEFPTKLINDDAFSLVIENDPINQQCDIDVGGTLSKVVNGQISNSNTEYSIICSDLYTVGGTIMGLPDGTVVNLSNIIDAAKPTETNDPLSVTITADPTSFNFGAYLSVNQTYKISAVSPPGYSCNQISNGSGVIASTNVDNVVIDCIADTIPQYTISGLVTGLETNTSGLTWSINSTNTNLPAVISNGAVDFGVRTNGSYTISLINPTTPSQTCTIQQGTGPSNTSVTVDVNDANVTNLAVNCITNNFGVSLNVTNLNAPATFDVLLVSTKDSINLPMNISDTTSLPATFSSELFDGSDYAISITSQPADQTCLFGTGNNVSGIISGNSVTETITCASNVSITGVVNQLINTAVMDLTLSKLDGATVANASATGNTTGVSAFSLANIPLYSSYNLGFSVLDHTCNFNASSAGTVSQDGQSLQIDVVTQDITTGVFIDCASNGIPLAGLFADTNLQACIDKLGLQYAHEVIAVDCTNKSADQMTKISSLSGIEKLLNLTTLNLSGNNVSAITPLTGLTLLSDLNLSDNKINLTNTTEYTDINSISSLIKLDLSNASGTSNNNVSLFGFTLSGLTDLNLNFNSITSLQTNAFLNVQKLQNLSIQGNGLTNIDSSLSMLGQLIQLNLPDNKISDVTTLGALSNVSSFVNLDLTNNNIVNVTPLSMLTQLITLDVRNNKIEALLGQQNVDTLVSLTNATNIDLRGNYNSNLDTGMPCGELETLIGTLNDYVVTPNKIVVNPQPASSGLNCKGNVIPTTYTISGTISNDSTTGHTTNGLQLELFIDGASNQTLDITTNNSSFSFTVSLPTPNNSEYRIAVSKQPTDELFCSVTTNAGPAPITGNISSVSVKCTIDPLVKNVADFNLAYGAGFDVFNNCITELLILNPPNGNYSTLKTSEVIGVNAPGRLTCADSTKMIADLYGLQFLDQITKLYLSNQKISKIDIIVSMSQLKELGLNNNLISLLPNNLNTLTLNVLDLSQNRIVTVEPLRNMIFDTSTGKVNNLQLNKNAIIDASPLFTTSNLNVLSLQDQNSDISPDGIIFKPSLLSPLVVNNNNNFANSITRINLIENMFVDCTELETLYNMFNSLTPAPTLIPSLIDITDPTKQRNPQEDWVLAPSIIVCTKYN